jgi:putative holliday junction resolvase
VTPILGIDYGRARIGVAISDEVGLLAHPLETISSGADAVKRISEIVRDRKIDTIVVGMPKTLKGEHGLAAEEVSAFVEKLRSTVTARVVTWDERLSTAEAQRALREAGKNTRQSRRYVDQVAAQIILQGYLDSLALS